MNFNLTSPCKDCPFRTDVVPFLSPGRAAEIADALLIHEQTFTCHKTNKFDDNGEVIETPKSEHCAGALIFCETHEKPNQVMRIAERLGLYHVTRLDMDAPVYPSKRAMVAAYWRGKV